jgi:homoserine kinase
MKIRVPASTTNFGAGFDTFGLALDLYNTFEFEPSDRYGVEIEGYGGELPRDESNLVLRVYKHTCGVLGLEEIPLRLRQINRVPTARGLGSSATAIVGGVEMCLALHRREVPVEEKLRIAMEFEPHPDNVIPALVGGFVLCLGNGPSFVRMGFPRNLKLVFAVPNFELSTRRARDVLRREVPLEDCVFNVRRASLFMYALLSGRYELFKTAVQDRLHQPFRSRLVPGFERVLRRGYEAGALAVFLSGSGPSVGAICPEDRALEVERSMVEAFREEGVEAFGIVTGASERGVHLL